MKAPHGRVVWIKDLENDEGGKFPQINHHYLMQLARDIDRRTLPLLPWFVRQWPQVFGRFVRMTWKDHQQFGIDRCFWTKELERITVF